ncbi:RagB/SusD family nutrient uptake outer membrane protein [Robertkochia flava]|uniref:RagB/SusD family nutrient uptake outer membrane protein n=1 Tax=Robertkochia flava TaxID=3447986 RepID=UPI001CCD6C79|nr:RagB/SusD family nutrient uptake outer membrane protein [Robertkochia marina]
MKLNKYYYLLLFIAVLFSCEKPDDFLDVKPTGRVIPTTLEDFDNLLNGIDMMFSRNIHMRYMDPDVYMNEASYASISGNSINENAYNWNSDLTLPDQANSDYNESYQFIHMMNFVLSEIDEAETGTFNPADRTDLKAEAHAQRAMELFLAVTEFAPAYSPENRETLAIAMPLEVDISKFYSKRTLGEVYDQILLDLNSSLELLSPGYPAYNKVGNFRPGKASIYALLAEVHLHMGNFEEAREFSDRALNLYSFLYDWNDIDFTNPEDPWAGYNTGVYDQVDASEETLWNRSYIWSYANPWQLYHPDLANLYDQDNDRRWYLRATQVSPGGVDVSPDHVFMFPRAYTQHGLTTPRLILTNAEAKARTGDGAGAIAVLNTLLENRISNFTPLTHSDDATTLQIIKNERRKELVGTALNLLDLKRYHAYGEAIPTFSRTNPVSGATVTLEPGDEDYYVKIPAQVRNLNPNLN